MILYGVHLILFVGTVYNIASGTFPDPQNFSAKVLQQAQSTVLFVFLVVVYYLLLACVSHRGVASSAKVRAGELPHTQHQCLYCCVKSEGRVAEIRLKCLFLFQSAVLYAWSYCLWVTADMRTAQQLIVLNEVLIVISWYHLMKASAIHSVLYTVNIGIFLFWGIYTTHVAFSAAQT